MKNLKNTEKSEKQVKQFLTNRPNLSRKVQVYEQTIKASPEEIFPQLCPSRECDWIDGWEADLLYTSTGYQEIDCIFKTSESNPLGPGLWIITVVEPNSRFEAFRVINDSIVISLRIRLSKIDNNTTKGVWNIVVTAIKKEANQMVDSLPDESPEFRKAILGLVDFLN